jgi:hypothetical protein
MNETFINLVNYLRLLARQHLDIKAFGVGELYELNDFDNFQYPLMWLELPFDTNFIDLANPDRISMSFKLHILTNVVYDKNTNPVTVTESMISKSTNQISYTDLALQDQLVNNAFRILTQICTRIAIDIAKTNVLINIDNMVVNIPMVLQSLDFTNNSRTTNKDLYQSTATFSIIIENSYFCPIDSYFDFNIQ